ncbi:MAG: serine/threonine protein kinase [Gammaproteobacteria bacterium]|nr:serine/threonine protein kinase [Gammaproteobacteria bacterium]
MQNDGKEAPEAPDKPEADYEQLPAQYPLTAKYVIEKRLGRGSFSIVYKAVDIRADVPRAIKLAVKDRYSPLGRLKQEYRASQALQEYPHPHVVKLYEADVLPDGVPYLVFEYVDGLNVECLIGMRSLEENRVPGRQAADALCHLHRHEVFHCDIKPKNLLWTDKGAKLIDFNVSVRAADAALQAGGSRRYLPPDYDFGLEPRAEEPADRDAYAPGLTLYQLPAGEYPWPNVNQPPPGKAPQDPGTLPDGRTLSAGLIEFLRHALAPRRSERFQDMPEMLKAMQGIQQLTRIVQADTAYTKLWLPVKPEFPENQGEPVGGAETSAPLCQGNSQ